MKAVVVVIPTYNEAENIERLIRAIVDLDMGLEILVVDDNSPDGTGRIVGELSRSLSGIHALNRQKKSGLSSAYRDGFKWALEQDFDYIIQMDGDLSHDPKYISGLIKGAEKKGLCIGSRYIPKGQTVGWSLHRRLLSHLGNFYVRFWLGLPIRDCTGGFRCFRKDVLKAVDLDAIKSEGYLFQIEILNYCIRCGFGFLEVPIAFTERQEGYSKLGLKEITEATLGVAKLRFYSQHRFSVKS